MTSPELRDPFKIVYTDYVLTDQLAHHIFGMDLNDNECRKYCPLHARQLPPHQSHQVTELREWGNHYRDLRCKGSPSATGSFYILGVVLVWDERRTGTVPRESTKHLRL